MTTPKRFAALAGLILALAVSCYAANEKITWKPLPEAILRVDDSPPKQWNLYSASKKLDPLLLQFGARSLLIYVRQQEVYEIAPAKLVHKGAGLLWRETDKPDQPLATSNWIVRDVGSAARISMKLTKDGHVIDIELPEALDNHIFF